MHFQVRTDNHIENSEALTESIRDEIEGALGDRYNGQIRRVEVYLQDMNSHKEGIDTRCTIEVHLAGHEPVVVHATSTTVEEAVDAGADKMLAALENTLGRLADGRDRISMSGEPT